MEYNLLLPQRYYPVVLLQNVTATATSEDMVGRYKKGRTGTYAMVPTFIHYYRLYFLGYEKVPKTARPQQLLHSHPKRTVSFSTTHLEPNKYPRTFLTTHFGLLEY
jgi:hypothetical protein